MRRCWLLAAIVLLPVMACGCGKPDPRSRPDYVDTTDPKDSAKAMQASSPSKAKQTPRPGNKQGGS